MLHSQHSRHDARHHVGLFLALVGLMIGVAFMSGPTSFVSAQAVAPSWSFTGNLSTARSGHTATLLPNGKVLVAGGSNRGFGFPAALFNSAELYDPATGTWSSTGNLNTARADHTATLLFNGKVLVAGGGYFGHPQLNGFNSAELYDPATGEWSTISTLNAARHSHTATLLPNGKVLVVGGYSNGWVNSAELYDPATGTWSSAGNPGTHSDHTATLLPDGKVLTVGGPGGGAGLYDPTTETWSVAGNPNIDRYAHAATLLPNGNVLVAGGLGDCNNIDCFPLNSTELYNPATDTWSVTGNLNSANGPATLLSNGKVLAVGGDELYGYGGNSTELYDQATGTWKLTASLNTNRSGHTVTLLPNGKVLVVGGSGDNTAELYDPGTDSINLIDDAQFFVRQHYLDFLNREPDASGLAFWTNEITACGTDIGCVEAKRVNVSAAFFLSIEFQQTGYFVYRIHKAAYGNISGAPVPIRLSEFLPDTRQIGQGVVVNQAGWEQLLENNKLAFTSEFVQGSRFASAYQSSITPAEFVDTLFANAGVTPSATDRAEAINEFGSATTTSDTGARSRALRRVAENRALAQQEFNRAFVLMQYFGYLRRNPNDPPDADFSGYNFWLNKLNQFDGNFVSAEMVKAFIVSSEYRQRFSQL